MRWQQARLRLKTPAANADIELMENWRIGITAKDWDFCHIIGTLGATGRNAGAVEFCGRRSVEALGSRRG